MRVVISLACLGLSLSSVSWAFDSACEPIIQSSEAKIAQAAWHSSSEMEGLKMEAIKVDKQFFLNMDGKWQKSPMDLDQVEKTAIEQMRGDKIKVTNCKVETGATLDGKAMSVISYTTEIPDSGIPAAITTLYIGKEDHLPYKLMDKEKGSTLITYRYKDVSAPKL